MDAYAWSLITATFVNALLSGFLFAFAVVVMPGISRLGDRDYLRSFQAIDGVIQSGQPLFMLMWLGSTAALVVTAAMAILSRELLEQIVTVVSASASVLLVQLPTMRINIPLNNKVQSLDLDTIDDALASDARSSFEARWVFWNSIRTLVSCAILVVLLLLLWRL
ncbi:hypothetical protein MalM25_23780 [Planctomycetes bacterium MalM25]|nr:hypothetical protein MalM25_23780 [Planctomycetes bacterium MalM25]